MSLKQLTQPASEPVALALVKRHLAIDHDDDNDLITADIRAARVLAERHTGLIFGSRSFRMQLSCWPPYGRLKFPVEPVASVTSFGYTDENDASQTIASSNWRLWLDHSPPILDFTAGYTFPALSTNAPAPVSVEFVAGDDANNDAVGAAIRLMCEYWRDNPSGRGETSQGFRELPPGAVGVLNLLWTGGL